MGTTAEFFVSRPKDLEASDPLASRAGSFPAIEVSGVTPETLADLEGLVAKRAPKISKEVASAGDEGPWVNVLSDAFVGRLAGLDSHECDELATKWLKPKAGRKGPLVGDLAALCRIAVRANETRGNKPTSPAAWHVYRKRPTNRCWSQIRG